MTPEEASAAAARVVTAASAPEREVYLFLVAVGLLQRYSRFAEAARFAQALLDHALPLNRRSLDWFTARAFSELGAATGRLGHSALRALQPYLIASHRTACLRHDEVGQATLTNLLLRIFIDGNEFALAHKFIAKTSFPEEISLGQFVRFLFYRGRIHAVKLAYTEAYADLLQALRKAPTNTATGFKRLVQKHVIIVQLLMGDIPERVVFNLGEGACTGDARMARVLRPYLELTQAVRVGDLAAFADVVELHRAQFVADRTASLVARLRQNVIKTGLRKVVTSYSRISFADIAVKLRLDSAEDAESVCAKAVRDGVIDGVLNHEEGTLSAKNDTDVYATADPTDAFDERIRFCLEIHNDAVRAMQYPAGAFKRDAGSAEALKRRDAEDAELAAAAEGGLDDDEEGFDDDL